MNLKQLKKTFKNKKIFITGNTGFVGSYLSITLSLMKSNLLCYSLKKNNHNYLSNFRSYKKKIKTINDDLKNISRYKKTIKEFKPEIVIHLASQPIVKTSYENPINTFNTNIFGTVNLLETLKDISSVKQILIFTSDKVYKNQNNNRLNENSSLGGIDPYSASKSSQDIIANSYKESFFKKNKNVIIIRAGNIIGGGDWELTRLLPDLFNSVYKNKKIVLRNPSAIRPWQHILDVVSGIMQVLVKKSKKVENKSIIFNIGPNNLSNITVLELIKKIKKNHKNIDISYSIKKISFKETKVLKLSNKLFRKKTGWKQRLNINNSIKLTYNWYNNFYKNKKNIFKYTEEQILDFFK
tara:strand:- start:436 stop:1494 length:1059 start_codon:yes stop_codon:yes gene_type:complete